MSASSYHDARRHSLTEWIKRQIVPLFDAALVGGQLQKEYVAFLGLPRERIFAGYDVVDNAYFSQKSEIARQQEASLRQALQLPNPFFLASGRFVVKKNFTNLIEAYARYRHLSKGSPWDLVLLGDGPSRNEITATIHQFGMSGVVHMPGFIQYDSLPDYYGLASAFVHASTTEQWGLVVNEAMASGLPVLLSKACGCVPDLVEEGKNGFTFDPLDQGQLALLMLRMANGDANLEVMGNASREIILRWAPETFADNLWQAARLALQVPGRRTPILSHLILNSLVHWFGKALPSHS
jgi:glycosyltransferase involved in cell wall biosynthesis